MISFLIQCAFTNLICIRINLVGNCVEIIYIKKLYRNANIANFGYFEKKLE